MANPARIREALIKLLSDGIPKPPTVPKRQPDLDQLKSLGLEPRHPAEGPIVTPRKEFGLDPTHEGDELGKMARDVNRENPLYEVGDSRNINMQTELKKELASGYKKGPWKEATDETPGHFVRGRKKTSQELSNDKAQLEKLSINELDDTFPAMREQGGREVMGGATARELTDPSVIPEGTPVIKSNDVFDAADLPPETVGQKSRVASPDEADKGFTRGKKTTEDRPSVESDPDRILLDDLEVVKKQDARLRADMESIIDQLPSGERSPERIRQLARERVNALEADIVSKSLQGPTKRQIDRKNTLGINDIDTDVDVNTGNLEATLRQKKITPAIAGKSAVDPKESKEAVKRLNKQIAAPIAKASARSGRQTKELTPLPMGSRESFDKRVKPSADELRSMEDLITGPSTEIGRPHLSAFLDQLQVKETKKTKSSNLFKDNPVVKKGHEARDKLDELPRSSQQMELELDNPNIFKRPLGPATTQPTTANDLIGVLQQRFRGRVEPSEVVRAFRQLQFQGLDAMEAFEQLRRMAQ